MLYAYSIINVAVLGIAPGSFTRWIVRVMIIGAIDSLRWTVPYRTVKYYYCSALHRVIV